MTDRTESGGSVRRGSGPYAALMARGGRFLVVVACIVLMVGGLVAGFAAGRYVAYRDLPAARALVRQLQSQGQKLRSEINGLNVNLTTTEAKLESVQAELESIKPSKDRYAIDPNESINVAGGLLTIGLIGSPSNERITLNINGKEQSAATGDVIKIAPDASTKCQIGVQSFDMFKALLTASCDKAH